MGAELGHDNTVHDQEIDFAEKVEVGDHTNT